MSTPFIGEIIMFAGNFAVKNYSFCNGTLLNTSDNATLFSLLGTMYGGDGRTTFGLPDFRGRAQVSVGNSPGTQHPWPQGLKAGAEDVTLLEANLPVHSHNFNVALGNPTTGTAEAALVAKGNHYVANDNPNITGSGFMYDKSVGNAGANAPLPIMSPFIVVNFMIAMNGIYPTRA